jgi:hypothetical protein
MGSMPNPLPSMGGTQEMQGPTAGATPHHKCMPISPVLSSHWHDVQIPRSHLTGMTLNVPTSIPRAQHPNPSHPQEQCGVPTVGMTPHPNACPSCHSSHPTGVVSNFPLLSHWCDAETPLPPPIPQKQHGAAPPVVISSGANTFGSCCFSRLTCQ